ncbi:two-component system response regulator CreB [Methylomonas sp. SURF-1]|uniref:Two-component system response regulator CreB n=1 Tax=Methylomonas aurea TaxID=2952224 RepID=A0ABT1UNT8_9GAMM|nr:two-component system response regulator CreB [Methylomonas sp. SURF-1]
MGPQRILIVEDEPAIADTLIYALRQNGYQPEHADLLQTGLARLQAESFALAILDVGLPDGSGFELCRQLRRFSQIPVMFLTAHGDEIDRIVGLEIGADDYVTKPFSPREVAARVGAILRRMQPAPIQPGNADFELDGQAGRIRYCGRLLELTRYEYLLLKLLIEHPTRIFSREQLLERVWRDPGDVFDRTVDTHIKTLRAKLRAIADADPIRTHRGLGYSLESR